jgi:hypothetical protein
VSDHKTLTGIDLVEIMPNGLVKVDLDYGGDKPVQADLKADAIATVVSIEETLEAEVSLEALMDLEDHVWPGIPMKLFSRFTADHLNRMRFPEVEWVMPELLPAGLTVFAGKPKVGKSWWAMLKAVEVATTGDVLYLALEDPPRRLQSRMRMVLNGKPVPSALEFRTDWPRLDKGGLDELRDWLDTHPAARAVWIDTIAKVRPPRRDKEDQYLGDYGIWGPLQALTIQYPSVGIIGIHHQRKSSDEDVVSTVLGSQGVTGVADSIVVLRKARGQADGELYVTGRDVEEIERALKFSGGVWTDIGPAKDFRLSQERDELKTLLTVEGPMKVDKIARSLGIQYRAALMRCRRAQEAGVVQKDGETYKVVVDGE